MKRKVQLVEKFWKTWSFQISAAATAVASLEFLLPSLEAQIPRHWYLGVFAAIMIARAIKQAIDSVKEVEAEQANSEENANDESSDK